MVYWCRSQAPKFWAPFQSTGAFITILPAAVPVVVSVYSLVAQGPRIVPRSLLYLMRLPVNAQIRVSARGGVTAVLSIIAAIQALL